MFSYTRYTGSGKGASSLRGWYLFLITMSLRRLQDSGRDESRMKFEQVAPGFPLPSAGTENTAEAVQALSSLFHNQVQGGELCGASLISMRRGRVGLPTHGTPP